MQRKEEEKGQNEIPSVEKLLVLVVVAPSRAAPTRYVLIPIVFMNYS